MKSCVVAVSVALSICLTGCHSGGMRCCATRHFKAGGQCVVAKVVPVQAVVFGEKIPVDQALRLPDVAGAGRTWQILVGANPGGGAATLRYRNEEPDILVENGWVYIIVQPQSVPTTAPAPVSGSPWGQARTRRVTATAEGTRFIVQHRANGDVHRVILLSGLPDELTVELKNPGSDTQSLSGAMKYFEVGSDEEKLPAAQDVPDPTKEVGQLVAYVESVAEVAGVK